MADILLLCLSEDEAAAQSLAATFERAGLLVDGCDGTDAEVAAAPATLILWTQAAARTPAMRTAAQRIAKSGKALVAVFPGVREPPPPGAKAFDLSKWSGDPDDPAIDALFVAVDRLVARARELVFTPSDEVSPAPEPAPRPAARMSFEAPARRAEPPMRPEAPRPEAPRPEALRPEARPDLRRAEPPRAPPSDRFAERAPAARDPVRSRPAFEPARGPEPRAPEPRVQEPRIPAGADPLAQEAADWRSVRDSRDPAVLERFIARYGQDGAFAELAQLKLQRLQSDLRAPAAAYLPAARDRGFGRDGFDASFAAPPRFSPLDDLEPPPIERRRPTPPPAPKEGGGVRAFALVTMALAFMGGGALYFTGGDLSRLVPIVAEATVSPSEDVAAAPIPDAEPMDEAPSSFTAGDVAEPAPPNATFEGGPAPGDTFEPLSTEPEPAPLRAAPVRAAPVRAAPAATFTPARASVAAPPTAAEDPRYDELGRDLNAAFQPPPRTQPGIPQGPSAGESAAPIDQTPSSRGAPLFPSP